jgi:hypothetical protein
MLRKSLVALVVFGFFMVSMGYAEEYGLGAGQQTVTMPKDVFFSIMDIVERIPGGDSGTYVRIANNPIVKAFTNTLGQINAWLTPGMGKGRMITKRVKSVDVQTLLDETKQMIDAYEVNPTAEAEKQILENFNLLIQAGQAEE